MHSPDLILDLGEFADTTATVSAASELGRAWLCSNLNLDKAAVGVTVRKSYSLEIDAKARADGLVIG